MPQIITKAMPCQPSGKRRATLSGGVSKSTSEKAKRTPRISEDVWKSWDPRLIELYLEYDLKEVQKTLSNEGFSANSRQLRHRIEKLNIEKYNTQGHEAQIRRGRKMVNGSSTVPRGTNFELAQFWLALAAEKKAFPLCRLLYTDSLLQADSKRTGRAAIALARTATQAKHTEDARLELAKIADPDEKARKLNGNDFLTTRQDAASTSRAHVYAAYYAYTYGRSEKNEASKRAAKALAHLFGSEKPADFHESDAPLASHLDFVSYLGTSYCLDVVGNEPILGGKPFSNVQLEKIRAKSLCQYPAVRELEQGRPSTTHVVRECLKWMDDAFQRDLIEIPDALKEVPVDSNSSWRDEVEVFVAVWHYYFKDESGSKDGWRRDCEDHISLYPAELISLLLRCAMEDATKEPSDKQSFLTPPRDETASSINTPGSSPFLAPSAYHSRRRSQSPLSPISPQNATTPGRRRRSSSYLSTPGTLQRRGKLVRTAARCVRELKNRSLTAERKVWERMLDWYIDMNRLDEKLSEADARFQEEMMNAIEDWVGRETKTNTISRDSTSPFPSPIVVPMEAEEYSPSRSGTGEDDDALIARAPESAVSLRFASQDGDWDASSAGYTGGIEEMDEDRENYAFAQSQPVYPEPPGGGDKDWVVDDFD